MSQIENNNLPKKNENKLPTISEIYSDNLIPAYKYNQLNELLNLKPKKEWIKQNIHANNSNYIPIGIIETLLQKIFIKTKIEVIETKSLFNAVACTVRVHYWDGINDEWLFMDGVGAVQLQTKKGSSPSQLENINHNAVMMALPMAKSYAIKDACEHLGVLFGRDLNRKDVLIWDNNIVNPDVIQEDFEKALEMNITDFIDWFRKNKKHLNEEQVKISTTKINSK